MLRINQPLVLISQIQRCGGTLLSQLFDGHPQIHAHPYEVHIGHPNKWTWPKFDMTDDKLSIFDKLKEPATEQWSRTGIYKKESSAKWNTEYQIDFDYTGYKKYFIDKCERDSSRSVFNTYFESFFNAWRDYKNIGQDNKKYICGFTPRMHLDKKNISAFYSVYPDGHMISILRSPINWYASVKNHNFDKFNEYSSIDRAISIWCYNYIGILRNKIQYKDRYRVIAFEKLIGYTADVMKEICSELGIEFDDILLRPTFNGNDIVSDSSFKPKTGIDASTLDRTRFLDAGEVEALRPFDEAYRTFIEGDINSFKALSDFMSIRIPMVETLRSAG